MSPALSSRGALPSWLILMAPLVGFAVGAWQTDSALPLTATLAACACLSWLSGRAARPGT